MPQHPSTDERAPEPFEELRPKAPVFEVAPITTRTRVPLIALVGIVVGVLAFVAGIGVASAGPTQRPARSAESTAAVASIEPGASADPAVAVASIEPGASAEPSRPSSSSRPAASAAGPDAAAPTPQSGLPPAGSSAFATSFRPQELIAAAADGALCSAGEPREQEVPRTRRDGPRLTFQRTWLTWCQVPIERRQTLLVDVFESMVRDIPADTYGYHAADGGGGDALFPYAQPPLAGTVAVTADAAGEGFVISIVLQEWRSDQVR